MSKRLFKTMAAVLAIAAAAAGPVRGQSAQSETLLTTVTATGQTSYSQSPDGIVTVTLNNIGYYDSDFGWLSGSVTVEAPQGYTITRCVFKQYDLNFDRELADDLAPFTATIISGHVSGETSTGDVNGSNYMDGITSIEVYGYAPAVPHTVRFASGNDGWTVTDVDSARSATAPAVLQNVMAGDSLVVTAPDALNRKVKSVKAVKYVPPAATVATVPTATAAVIEVGSTAALVNAGAASGGTMMYAVTTTNAQPASTADFSASVPTAEGRAAGTYYVWFYAKADAEHSDGEIAGPVSVTVAVMTTVTWNSSNVFNSGHQDDMLNKWNTAPLTYEGITISFSGNGAASSFHAYSSGDQTGELKCFGQSGDSFTFTAPSGKKFARIEMTNNGTALSSDANWIEDGNKLVWSGTPSNTVEIAGDGLTQLSTLNTIVFKLIDD